MYNFKAVEKKWQKRWDDEQTFKAVTGEKKPKWYGLISRAPCWTPKKLYSYGCNC